MTGPFSLCASTPGLYNQKQRLSRAMALARLTTTNHEERTMTSADVWAAGWAVYTFVALVAWML